MILMRRRDLLRTLPLAGAAPAFVRAQSARPSVQWGVQSGDIHSGRGLVWSRTDRPARLWVDYATTEKFADARRVRGSHAFDASGYTARAVLRDLPPGQTIFYRVSFEDARDSRVVSEPVSGRFRTPPLTRSNVRFLWSGDTAGQGYGINPEWGGMRCYEAMLKSAPDFFIHSGDTIYADNPIQTEVKLPDGGIWKNITTPEKSKVAETLDEFRGNYAYNLLDQHVRRFNADVAQVWQWDDHEVLNNWSPGKDLSSDARYSEKSIGILAGRATQAFLEYAPMIWSPDEHERVYRQVSYGPLLDVFVLDMRSYRAANSENRQPQESAETVFLGQPQLDWLKRSMKASRALWKVVAADMPIGLIVGDGKDASGKARFEAVANGDGPALGRELEIASLLRFLKQENLRNVIWVTADVHYTAALEYHPDRAVFKDFLPFWEFVSGPLNAGTFGPGSLDNTFGPKVEFHKHPPKGQGNLPPSAGLQFFGEVAIDGKSGVLTVNLRDLTGASLWSKSLIPAKA